MKKYFIKTASKILIDYVTTVFLFSIFSISVLVIANQNTARAWWIGYSLVWFIMLMMMVYSRMKQVAQKEVIPQYDLHPFPLKGFVYGLTAMIPHFIVAFLNSVLVFKNEILNGRKLLVVKIFFGPIHAFVELTGDTPLSFYLVCLVIPIIAGAGYLGGYYGIYPFARMLGKS